MRCRFFYFMLVDMVCIYKMPCKNYIIHLLVHQTYVISILLWSSLMNVYDRSTLLNDIIILEFLYQNIILVSYIDLTYVRHHSTML